MYDTQNAVCPCNEILLGHKKEWSSDVYYNINEPGEHYAKQKKPVEIYHMLHRILFMCKAHDRHIYRDRKSISGFLVLASLGDIAGDLKSLGILGGLMTVF